MKPSSWFVWSVCGFALALSLTLPVVELPANAARLRRFATPDVAPDHTWQQTFTMTGDRLNAIEFGIAPSPADAAAQIELKLFDVTAADNPVLVRAGAVSAGALAGKSAYRFTFDEIRSSRRRTYKLQISSSSRTGVSLVATRGDAYTAGTLWVDGQPRSADLVFRTFVSRRHTTRLMSLWSDDDGSPFFRGRVILALLGATWLAAGVLLDFFTRLPRWQGTT